MKRIVSFLLPGALFACATVEERRQEQEFAAIAETVRREPGNLGARLLLGDKLAERGYARAAIDLWSESFAAHPGEHRFLRRIADLQYAIGREREAIASYEKLLSLVAPERDPEIDYKIGWASLRCRDFSKAVEFFGRYAKAQPQDAAGFVGLGIAELRSAEGQGNEHFLDRALQSLRRAVLLDPRSFDARFNLALALERKGQMALAAAEYEAILVERPEESAALTNLALLRLAEGKLRDARPLLERAVLAEKDSSRRKKIEAKLQQIAGGS